VVLVVTDYAVVSEFVIKKTRDYSAVVSYSKQVCCLSSFNLHCVLVLFCPDMLICEDVRGMEAMSGQMDRVLDVLLSRYGSNEWTNGQGLGCAFVHELWH